MSKHTNGKWRVGRKVGRTIYANDMLIGVMDRVEDARLSAAAPDLLEACKKAKRALELEYGEGCSDYLDSAIQKAEGMK